MNFRGNHSISCVFNKGSTLRGMVIVASMMCSMMPSIAKAIDVDAGDYTALPAGANLGILYYQYATRDAAYVDGGQQPGNPRLDSNIGIARGVHYMDVGGYIVDPQFLLPFGTLKGKDDLSAAGDTDGIGDLILAATVWLVNKPKSNTYFGITPFVYLPTGSYDKDDALNIGENRWKFALQAGYITGITHDLLLDVIADVTLFGKNDEFTTQKLTMKQDALTQVQTVLRYQLTPAWDLRAGGSYAFGGETKVQGQKQDNEVGTWKFMVSSAWFATPTLQFIAGYGRDLDVRNGLREADRVNLRVLKVF